MAKSATVGVLPAPGVRMRRAYFDSRFGQLHVRTAFPTTGGFDEQMTAFCLHPRRSTSRVFSRFLPLFAAERSVYAPDLPGCGESDTAPDLDATHAAAAVSDLAADLRVRQIDVVGLQDGADVALALVRQHPALVRRLVLVGLDGAAGLAHVTQPTLLLALGAAAPSQGIPCLPPHSQVLEPRGYTPEVFDAVPEILAQQFAAFLCRS